MNTALLRKIGQGALAVYERATRQEVLYGILERVANFIDEAEREIKRNPRIRYGDGSLLYYIQHGAKTEVPGAVLYDFECKSYLDRYGIQEAEIVDAINTYLSEPSIRRRLIAIRDVEGMSPENHCFSDQPLPEVRVVSTVDGIVFAKSR